MKTTIKKTSKKNVKKVDAISKHDSPNDKEVLAWAKSILEGKQNGVVIVAKVEETEGGIKLEARNCVRQVPKLAAIKLVVEGLNLDPSELLMGAILK